MWLRVSGETQQEREKRLEDNRVSESIRRDKETHTGKTLLVSAILNKAEICLNMNNQVYANIS